MSLISEALKKAEESMRQPAVTYKEKQQPINEASFPLETSPKKQKQFIILFSGGTLALTLLILIGILIFGAKPPAQNPSKKQSIIAAQSTQPHSIESIEKKLVAKTQKAVDFFEHKETIIESLRKEEIDKEVSDTEEDDLEVIALNAQPTAATLRNPLNPSSIKKPLGTTANSPSSPKEIVTANPKEHQEAPPTNKQQKLLDYISEKEQKLLARTRTHSEEEIDPIQAYINELNVTGVLISSNENKVLLNNQVYSKNSHLEENFDLELIEIKPRELTFLAKNGQKYRKSF